MTRLLAPDKHIDNFYGDNQYDRVVCEVEYANPHNTSEDRWRGLDLQVNVGGGHTSIGLYRLDMADPFDWELSDRYTPRRRIETTFGYMFRQGFVDILGPWEEMVGKFFVGLWPREQDSQYHGMDCKGIQDINDRHKVFIFEDCFNQYGKAEYDSAKKLTDRQRKAEQEYRDLLHEGERSAKAKIAEKYSDLEIAE